MVEASALLSPPLHPPSSPLPSLLHTSHASGVAGLHKGVSHADRKPKFQIHHSNPHVSSHIVTEPPEPVSSAPPRLMGFVCKVHMMPLCSPCREKQPNVQRHKACQGQPYVASCLSTLTHTLPWLLFIRSRGHRLVGLELSDG